jgi:hypothetical protein
MPNTDPRRRSHFAAVRKKVENGVDSTHLFGGPSSGKLMENDSFRDAKPPFNVKIVYTKCSWITLIKHCPKYFLRACKVYWIDPSKKGFARKPPNVAPTMTRYFLSSVNNVHTFVCLHAMLLTACRWYLFRREIYIIKLHLLHFVVPNNLS